PLPQYGHQLPNRCVLRIPGSAPGESLDEETGRAGGAHHERLPAVRDVHSDRSEALRALHYPTYLTCACRAAFLRGAGCRPRHDMGGFFFFRLDSRCTRRRSTTASSCPSSSSFWTSSSAK